MRELKLAQEIQEPRQFSHPTQRGMNSAPATALQHMQADADLTDSTELTPMRKENSRLRWRRNLLDYGSSFRELAPSEPTRKEVSYRRKNSEPATVPRARLGLNCLKQERQKALRIEDEQERILKANAIETALQREMDRWGKSCEPLFLGYNTKGKPSD